MPRAPRPPTLRPREVGTTDNPILVDENGRVVLTLRSRNRPATTTHHNPSLPASRNGARRAPRRSRDGARAPRDSPLTDKDLYLDNVRPPVLSPDRAHHRCPVCFNMKSHPILYACGHGSCYVCARKWLEYQWTCPTCRALVTTPPIRNFDIEAGISYDHPEWDDRSIVNFSWDGLKFPKVPIAPNAP
ncbi:hypothetical protein B0H11DRAFT_2262221 [Mycena galericulata]|nr:hypothetical protein B0H11DRAFT_2262221 [Mycena galericulata]